MKQGWKTETLGDVLDVIRNGVNCKQNKKGIGQKISRIETISQAEFDFERVGYSKLSDSEKEKYRLEKGDILFSHINSVIHVGKTAYYNSDEEIYHGVNLLLMRPKDFLSPRYLEYFLKSLFLSGYWRKICKQSVNQASVNQQDVSKVLINYPSSLPEQQRIVSLLDETFAGLAQVHANAERNLVNAREVFSSSLNEYFGHARKGWKEMKLDDACIVERGSSPRPIKQYQTTSKDGVNWIKIGDTKGVEKYIYSTREKITKEGAKQSRFVKEGDFILTNSMSFGNPYIMKTEGYIHDGWFVLRLKEFIDTEFFWYLLVSPFVQNQFSQLASGAIVKNISGDLVKKANLFIPPLEEQRAIVERLDALAAETSRLEAVYQSKLEAVEELKKSVLGKAFEGELSIDN